MIIIYIIVIFIFVMIITVGVVKENFGRILHGLFLPFLSHETFYQRVSGSDF